MNRAKSKITFTRLKSRHLAAILMSLLTATVMIPGMTTYLPLSTADKIGIPIFLFPFIWVALFIFCYMSKKVWHAWSVLSVLLLSHLLLSFLALT
jgi:heme/copper-type cytochrome/quinol oxidase subunit 4